MSARKKKVATKKRKAKPAKKETKRCTGHCCQKFFLPHSPAELRAAYMHWVKSRDPKYEHPLMLGEHSYGGRVALIIDIHLIYPMVRFITRADKPPYRVAKKHDFTKGAHYYTCVHWDKKSRFCSIYEIRPQMCSEYPYHGACNYAACTWEERKQKNEPVDDIEKGFEKKKCLGPRAIG